MVGEACAVVQATGEDIPSEPRDISLMNRLAGPVLELHRVQVRRPAEAVRSNTGSGGQRADRGFPGRSTQALELRPDVLEALALGRETRLRRIAPPLHPLGPVHTILEAPQFRRERRDAPA